MTSERERVKFAVTLLGGKALTWWRSIADRPFMRLGVVLFEDWAEALTE